MAQITDFASLEAAVVYRAGRTGDTAFTALMPDFIQLAESRIYRKLRVRQMETALSVAISSGVIAVPSGYLEMKYAYINGSPMVKMARKDAEWIYQNYPDRTADGTPAFFAREATNFIFGPYPDSAYTVKGVYYKQLAGLSGSNTTNWLITDCPDLIFHATLMEAAMYMRNDPLMTLAEQRFEAIALSVQNQDNEEEYSGSPLQMTTR